MQQPVPTLQVYWATLRPETRAHITELLVAACSGGMTEDMLLMAFMQRLLALPLPEQGTAWLFMDAWLRIGKVSFTSEKLSKNCIELPKGLNSSSLTKNGNETVENVYP